MSVTLKVCIVTAALNLSQTFSVIMALRRSRRLQQLQPEETNLGVCLICQGDFTIEVLHRLRKSDCCETLFHRCCFSQMMEHTSRCPACRHEHEPESPRALELPDYLYLIEADSEEAELQLLIVNDPQGTFATLRFQAQVSEEIYEYRSRGLPVPNRPGSPFWPILPYFMPEHYFFTYLSAIESFSQIYVGNTMAVVMRAWRVFLSSVNFSLIVNFIRDFSLFSDYILYQNGKLIRWSKTKPKWRRC